MKEVFKIMCQDTYPDYPCEIAIFSNEIEAKKAINILQTAEINRISKEGYDPEQDGEITNYIDRTYYIVREEIFEILEEFIKQADSKYCLSTFGDPDFLRGI